MLETIIVGLIATWLVAAAVAQVPRWQARSPWNRLLPSWMLFVAPLSVFDVDLEILDETGWRPVTPPTPRWWERPWAVTLRHRKVITDLANEITSHRRHGGRERAVASRAHATLVDLVRHIDPAARQFRLRTLVEPWPAGWSRILFLSDPREPVPSKSPEI